MLKETSLLNIIHCNSHTRQFCLYESEVTVLVAQSCLTVCDSMDYGLPDSFVHGDSPLSMGFSRQEDCIGLPFPSPGDLPDAGIEPRSPTLQADALTSEPRLPKMREAHVSGYWTWVGQISFHLPLYRCETPSLIHNLGFCK